MAYDGSLIFDTKIDSSGFDKGASDLKTSGAKLAASIAGIFALDKMVEGVVNFGKQAVSLASDLDEVQNVVDVTFEKNAESINDFAMSASKSFGMSELSAKEYSGTIGAMLKSMGLDSDNVTLMSKKMVQLAGDMASFYNLDHETAFEKIRAGISGETEPLKQLGVNMSVANLEAFALAQGIETTYQNMTQAQQATLRYNYLLSATADAQGDFARTSDSYANQQRIASLAVETLAGNIGKELLPMVTRATSFFGGLATELATAAGESGFYGIATVIQREFPLADAAVKGLAAAFGALTIVKTVSAIMQGYMATQATLTALEQAGTIAEWAEIGALTAKQVVVGVLSGKLSLATAAQLLFNAAVSANPIMLVVTAIGALVGGYVLLSNSIKNSTAENRLFVDEINQSKAGIDDLNQSMRDSKDAYNDNINDIEKNSLGAKALAIQLIKLSKLYKGTAAEQRQMSVYTDKLNESVDGLNLTYDEHTGALSLTEDKIYDIIEAREKEALYEARLERQTELLKEQSDAEYELYKATKIYNEALEKSFLEKAAYWTEDLAGNVVRAQQAYDDATENVSIYNECISESGTLTAMASEATDEAGVSMSDFGDTAEETAERTVIAGIDITDTIDNIGLSADDATSRFDALTESGTNLFEAMSEDSDLSVKQMTANLEKNAEILKNWRKNLQIIAGKLPSDLVQALIEQGPEKMAGAVAALAAASDKDLEKLSAAYKKSGAAALNVFLAEIGLVQKEETPVGTVARKMNSDKSMETAGKNAVSGATTAMREKVASGDVERIGTNMGSEIAAGLYGAAKDIRPAGENAVNAAVRGANSKQASMKDAGENAAQGFINGLNAKRSQVIKTATDLAAAASAAFAKRLKIHSPSKLFYEYGEFTIEGYTDAIRAGVRNVTNAMGAFSGAVSRDGLAASQREIKEVNSAVSQSATNNTNVTQNIYAQKQNPSDIMKEALWQQKRAVIMGV